MKKYSQFKWMEYLQQNRPDVNINTFKTWCRNNRPKKGMFYTEQELLQTLQLYDNRTSQFKSQLDWRQYLGYNRPDINISSFETWSSRNRTKKALFDTEQELLEAILLYDNRKGKRSDFEWRQYLQKNRPDINITNFTSWCNRYRPKKQKFYTEQELLQAILLHDNRRKQSQFNWRQYLKYNRPDINIGSFKSWCTDNRVEKQKFYTEQELLQVISLYDNNKRSDFEWRTYLKENRQDININNFTSWCTEHRDKKSVFNTEQELLQVISLYDNRQKFSKFNWKQYLKENRPDININTFKSWCSKNRPKTQIFNTEQELLQAISLYNNRDNRKIISEFNWQQYLKENRPDISINSFKTWCSRNRTKTQIFDTEQELIEAISIYDLCNKYIVRKTQYDGIYNLTERETGLRFNFYRLEDMIGLL